MGKVINLDEYRSKKTERKKNSTEGTNKSNTPEKNDREATFNLFMRVLSTIREESY